MLKSLLPDDIEMNLKNDDIRPKSQLTTNKTTRFIEKLFFFTILGLIQSHSRVLGDIEGFIQLFPGLWKSDEPNIITGVDKVHLKCGCVNGSILKGVRRPIFYSFSLDNTSGHKIYKELKILLFKKIKKCVLSHITFYLENDDHKPVDFNTETISFSCQLV